MRAYTLSVLSSLANSNNPIVEKEIVAWVNTKLVNAGKTSSLRSFQDSTIASGKVVIDLVDSIKPGSINYDLVKHGDSEEVSVFFLSHVKQLFHTLLVLLFHRIILPMPSMLSQWHVKLALVCMRYQRISPR